jgi:hypothetical protein
MKKEKILQIVLTVGAELAREGGIKVDIDVECYAAFASKLGSYR